MIKDVKNANEGVSANQNEIKILREHFPACFACGTVCKYTLCRSEFGCGQG